MAIAVKQGTTAGSANGSAIASASLSPTAGNTLVAIVNTDANPSVSDSQNQTWTQEFSRSGTTDTTNLFIYILSSCKGGSTTVTAKGQNGPTVMVLYEISGLGTTPTVDLSVGSVSTTNPAPSGNGTTAHSNEVLIGIDSSNDQTTGGPYDTGWSFQFSAVDANYFALVAASTKVLTSTGSYQYLASNGGNVSMYTLLFSLYDGTTPPATNLSVNQSDTTPITDNANLSLASASLDVSTNHNLITELLIY